MLGSELCSHCRDEPDIQSLQEEEEGKEVDERAPQTT